MKPMRDYGLDVCALPHASRSIHTAHVIAAPADVCLRAGRCMCATCVSANGAQVKAILKVRFRFVSREFAACER